MIKLLVVKLVLLPLLLGWQLQGGQRQTIQVTARTAQVQPATIQLQADPESGDNLQPAMGYEVLQDAK